jgi:hypothetical protein
LLSDAASRSADRTSRLRELAIRGDESFEHRHNELHGIGERLTCLAGEDFGIGDKIAVERRGQLQAFGVAGGLLTKLLAPALPFAQRVAFGLENSSSINSSRCRLPDVFNSSVNRLPI